MSVPGGDVKPIPFTAAVSARLGPLGRPVHRIVDDEPVRARHISDHVLSPDGKQLAFRALGRLWVMSWPNGKPRRLTRDEDGPDDETRPAWSADGRSILFSGTSARSGQGHLYEASIGAPGLRQLTKTPGLYASFAVTPGGDRIVAIHAPLTRDALFNGIRQGNLVTLPRAGGENTVLLPLSFR